MKKFYALLATSLLLASLQARGQVEINTNAIDFIQQATPACPVAGRDKLYAKSDNEIYYINSACVETKISHTSSVAAPIFTNLIPENGYVLPVSASRAYFENVLYSPTAIFNNGVSAFKYIAYFGNGTGSSVAYSNDGETWGNEVTVSGISAVGYHSATTLVGTTIHLFYWDSSLNYTPAAIRHATMNISVNASVATSDNPLSGTYIHGAPTIDLRYGTNGPAQLFYNGSPTNVPTNCYSFQWCMIHNGNDGNNEAILFATSTDGLNFSAYNGLNEVVPRGIYPAWDSWIGSVAVWITGSTWNMFYGGGIGTTHGSDTNFGDGIGYATSSDGLTWTKYAANPIIFKTYSFKSALRLYTPSVTKEDDGWKLYYTAKSSAGKYVVSKAQINVLQ